jgi:tetratricopeptide (TPR) repeat protein
MDPEGWYFQGKSIQSIEKQLTFYQRGLDSEPPQKGYALLGIGEIHLKARDLDKALRSFKEAIDNNPNIYRVYEKIKILSSLSKKPLDLVGIFQIMVETIPDDPWALMMLGKSHHNQENYRMAEKFFKKALELREKNVECWDLYGDTLHKLKDYYNALFAYQKTLPFDSFKKVWYKMGLVHKDLGKKGEAYYCFEKAASAGDNEVLEFIDVLKKERITPKKIHLYDYPDTRDYW